MWVHSDQLDFTLKRLQRLAQTISAAGAGDGRIDGIGVQSSLERSEQLFNSKLVRSRRCRKRNGLEWRIKTRNEEHDAGKMIVPYSVARDELLLCRADLESVMDLVLKLVIPCGGRVLLSLGAICKQPLVVFAGVPCGAKCRDRDCRLRHGIQRGNPR